MRRLVISLLLLLAACASPARQTPVGVATSPPTSPTPGPTATFTPPPPAPVEPSPTPAANFSVNLHPDGNLYVGDKVSIEVLSPNGLTTKDLTVTVSADGQEIGSQEFSPYGIAGRDQATFYWTWDTTGLQPGPHTLHFSVLPTGPDWQQSVSLLPASDLPPSMANAHWAVAETDCCTISYITGTEAERDIASLKTMADTEAQDVEQRLGKTLTEKIPVVLMSRVLGHGGFTSDAIYVSYLDRNYAGSTTAQVLHHEMVHWVDGKLGGDLRPTILVEGLAVYLSGGHFKPEALPPRAAALLDLNWYIPLRQLTDAFYPAQHEIGYMEAGALVQYLVETYGWQPFNDFYRDIHPQPSGKQSDALDVALQKHFGITLDELEKQWIAHLRTLPSDPAQVQDVTLTVQFYDTVRRYQRLFDPSAYFQTAWLPDAKPMREQGIVADYLRHPDTPLNIYLETMLVGADANLRAGNYSAVSQTLKTVGLMLDVLQRLQ